MKYPTVKFAFQNLLFAALVLFSGTLSAQKELPKPTGYLVSDFARTMSPAQVQQLGEKLSAYARETSIQIVVVTENSLEGEDAFEYSNRLAKSWGIGDKANDTGILIYVAKAERKVRIQTGYGVEGFLTDALSKRIIEQIIVPEFKKGDFYAGIDGATSAIMDLGKGEYTNEGGKQKSDGGRAVFLIFFMLFLLIAVLFIYNQFRKNGNDDEDDDGGYYRGGRYDERGRRGGGWFFFPIGGFGGGSSSGGNSGGWGGFGGGDFGGFGGGDFGGGGAGGDW